jgi:hypothetical protein
VSSFTKYAQKKKKKKIAKSKRECLVSQNMRKKKEISKVQKGVSSFTKYAQKKKKKKKIAKSKRECLVSLNLRKKKKNGFSKALPKSTTSFGNWMTCLTDKTNHPVKRAESQ